MLTGKTHGCGSDGPVKLKKLPFILLAPYIGYVIIHLYI